MKSVRPDTTDPIPLRTFPAPDGHHHDPVCRAAVPGGGGAGADLEPLDSPLQTSDLPEPREFDAMVSES